jgi:acid phosphatase
LPCPIAPTSHGQSQTILPIIYRNWYYLVETILPLLQEYGAQVYFNGHDHDLQHLQAENLTMFCTGAGAKPRPTQSTSHTLFAKGNTSGFVTVSLQAEKMVVQMINGTGAVLHTATVNRA